MSFLQSDYVEYNSGQLSDYTSRLNILKYLDQSGHLLEIQKNGTVFSEEVSKLQESGKECRTAFTFPMKLDLLKLCDISDELCLLMMEKPLQARELFKSVVHCSLVTLCEMPLLQLDQVQVLLRVDSLPAKQGLKVKSGRLPDPGAPRLLFMQGVIVALSTCNKYIRSAAYRCGRVSCPGFVARRLSERELRCVATTHCRFCGAAMEETKRSRDVGDEVYASVVDPEALRPPQDPAGAVVAHPTILRFTDDLAHGLELGQRYDLVVLAQRHWLEVWGVSAWLDPARRRVDCGIRSDPLPEAVQKIWLHLQSQDSISPWCFAVALASQLAGNHYPPHAFLHLRLGILLSLASQGLEHPPLPLLVLGDEPAGQRMLSGCMRLAARGVVVTAPALSENATGCVKTSAPNTATPSAKLSSASSWLSAGPLTLARGGVCLLGCWAKWSKTAAGRSVRAALESGRATLESRGAAGLETQRASAAPSVPIRCAVWTYWSPGNSQADGAELRTLLNTLGVPLLSECGCDPADVANQVIQIALHGVRQSAVPEDQLAQFLALVNAQPVSLSDEATKLIQEYFVASRRVRPNCLPVTAVGTMVAMAESLARISLRKEATWADVVLVVWMFEVAMTTLFGPCPVFPLMPDLGLPLRSGNVTAQMDSRLMSMKMWLDNLTRSVFLSSLRVQPSETDSHIN